MSTKFLYIGGDKEYIAHFRGLIKGELTVVDNLAALLSAAKNEEMEGAILLYEKQDKKYDLPRIKNLRKSFHDAYIILVASMLDAGDGVAYLKSGINNTASPSIPESSWNDLLRFLNLHKTQISNIRLGKDDMSVRARLPLWKRTFDIVSSLLALIVLSPLMLLVAAAIKIENPGPVIYKSKRVGSNYRIFDFLKFRSMYTDADRRLKEFRALNQYESGGGEDVSAPIGGGMVFDDNAMISDDMLISDDYFVDEQKYVSTQRQRQDNSFVKLENDPRITRVGRFIRKYSIDELPQLINILRGDMSVVGNRPLPLYEAELLTRDEYIDRFMAPAGLTGLWQVEKRGEAGKLSAEERKQLDIEYAKNYNFWMDMRIIFKTLTAFVQKENV